MALIAASVLATARRADEIYAELDALNGHHRQIEAKLRRLRSDVHLSGIFIRDYLLDPDRSHVAAYRAELTRLRASHAAALQELRDLTRDEGVVPIATLASRVDDYWAAFEPVFDWSLVQKVLQSATFLRREVVPRREAVLGIAEEIEQLNDANLAAQRAAVARRQEAFRAEIRRMLWQTMIAGLAVSLIAVLRLRVAERRSQEQQARAEEAEAQLRGLSHGLVEAQEEERRKLSRELHDHVGQMLTALRMSLARAGRADSSDRRDAALADARSLVDELLQSVRDLSLGLRPSMLDDFGLTPALEWLVRDTQRRSNLAIGLAVTGPAATLDDEVRTCVYRIVQEALTNCVRHAAARQVAVTVAVDGREVLVEVRDDGCGLPDGGRARGLGLLGIEERARELRGAFDVRPAVGGGTQLRVRLPRRAVDVPEEAPHAAAAG